MLRADGFSLLLTRSAPPSRRGSAAVLIVCMIFVLVTLAAFTVDYGYMQLVRTELRAATDAAAKAGAEALSRTQDPTTAKEEAVRYAALNSVGGRPFQLSTSDIVLGRVNPSDSGRWVFKANGTPPNAVQISARTGSSAAHPAVPLFFSGVLGKKDFSPAYQATAGQQEVEICLCLDRSGSMNFDMTGEEYSFAPNNPLLVKSLKSMGFIWQNMLSPPHPTASRWAALDGAINVFLTEVGKLSTPPRTALVTWGSDCDLPIKPYTHYSAYTKELMLPASGSFSWTTNAAAIDSVVTKLGSNTIMGGTNLSAGLDAAVDVLQGANSNKIASKVVVLLTDGEWNEGRDPMLSAYDARAEGIIVHCVSMLTESQSVLEKIASTTGGRYWKTRNEAELRKAFTEIANSLPIVLTE